MIFSPNWGKGWDYDESQGAGTEKDADCWKGNNESHVEYMVSANFGKKVQEEMTENSIRMTLLTDCNNSVDDIIKIIKHKQLLKTI